MAPFPTFMRQRNRTFHYRRRVPADMRHYFDGLHEFTKTCMSTKKGDARAIHAYYDLEITKTLAALRINAVTPEFARQKIDALLLTTKFVDSPAPAPYTSASELTEGAKFAAVVDIYRRQNEPNWSEKTRSEKNAIHAIISARFGGKATPDITVTDILNWRDDLRRKLGIVTVNKYMSNLSGIFKFAVTNRYTTVNPTAGMQLNDTRIESEIRKAYDETDILLIFKSLLANKEKWYKTGRHERFIAPLLAMYTGLRADEIAQLDVADIDVNECCVTVTAAGSDKKVKNKSSIRDVPLHPDLLTLGLLVYVRNTAAAGHTKLFPRLYRHKSNGYAHELIKWWGRWGRALVPDPKKTFHSFRHRVADTLKQNEVEPTIISEILGHHVESISVGRYGKAFRLGVMSNAMRCLSTGLVPEITDFTLTPIDDGARISITYRVNNMPGTVTVKVPPAQLGITLDGNINYLEAYQRPDWYGFTFMHTKHLPQLWREPITFELCQDVLARSQAECNSD